MFLQNTGHINLFQNVNHLNGCFIDIIDLVCSYRIELGSNLQSLIECYNSIFIQQYQVFYNRKMEKEEILDKKIKEVDDEMKKLERFRFLLDEEREHRIKVIESKDREMEILQKNTSNLEA